MTPLASLGALLILVLIRLVILGHGLTKAAARPRPTPCDECDQDAFPIYGSDYCDAHAATPDAAPAPQTPAVPERALTPAQLCAVLTCSNPWTVPIHGWNVCDRHDHRAPYDRTVDPELVSDEAEQWLRGAS